jgi:hypothetical protein
VPELREFRRQIERGLIVAKYTEFENAGETMYGKPEYLVKSKSGGNVLARIIWYPCRRQWMCEPAPNTIWSQDCLADICEYMLSLSNATGERPIKPQKEDRP